MERELARRRNAALGSLITTPQSGAVMVGWSGRELGRGASGRVFGCKSTGYLYKSLLGGVFSIYGVLPGILIPCNQGLLHTISLYK